MLKDFCYDLLAPYKKVHQFFIDYFLFSNLNRYIYSNNTSTLRPSAYSDGMRCASLLQAHCFVVLHCRLCQSVGNDVYVSCYSAVVRSM